LSDPAVEAESPADLARRRHGLRTDVSLLVAVLLQGIVWWALVHYFKTHRVWYHFFDVSDISLYTIYADAFARGEHAYTDVAFEYPPLAVPLMLFPKWLPPSVDYWAGFASEMMFLCAATAVFATAVAARLSRGFARPMATAFAFSLLTLLAGPIVANRFDIAVGLDMAIFAYCVARRWWWPAAATLGIGFALKLTPAMFLPLVFILAAKPRRILISGLAFLVAAVLPFVPHLLRAGRGVLKVFTYHTGRPLQIESLYATPYLVAHALGMDHVVIGNSHGSQSLVGPGTQTLASLSMWLMPACTAAAYLLIWRRRKHLRESPSDVALAALALVLIFVCTSKVLSPQFLIWTLPLVALVAADPRASRRTVGCLLLLAVVLTHIGFPARYWDLVALQTTPIYLVAARNLILLATTALVVVLLWRWPRRSTPQCEADAPTEPPSTIAQRGS
jgi:hypothetical protein